MKIIAKHGFAFDGVEYVGGKEYEISPEVYEQVKSDVTIVETVPSKVSQAQNTAQKTSIKKKVSSVKTK